MTQEIYSHRFDNGLTLVAESMPWLESAAFAVLLPAGAARDPADRIGITNFTCEMVQRGCGERDSRRFVEDLENLGVDRSVSVTASHTSFGGAVPADRLPQALSIYADLVQAPHLPQDQLEEGRQVCFQEVRAVEDDLSQKAMLELQRRFYPEPLGRSPQGTMESVQAVTAADIRRCFEQSYTPCETIISVAGKIQWEALREQIAANFGSWTARELPPTQTVPAERGHHHIQHQSSQTQVTVAYAAVPYAHPDYYRARGAVGVLSGGMSSRLFSEVREKRGLCYSVYAMMHSLREHAGVFCYAGTSTERAQETLDVLVAELRRLQEGIEQSELDRLKVQIRSSLVMQQESSRSRAAVIAGDWYHLGRIRSMDEVLQAINDLTVESINEFVRAYPADELCVVTLGAEALEMPRGVS